MVGSGKGWARFCLGQSSPFRMLSTSWPFLFVLFIQDPQTEYDIPIDAHGVYRYIESTAPRVQGRYQPDCGGYLTRNDVTPADSIEPT